MRSNARFKRRRTERGAGLPAAAGAGRWRWRWALAGAGWRWALGAGRWALAGAGKDVSHARARCFRAVVVNAADAGLPSPFFKTELNNTELLRSQPVWGMFFRRRAFADR